MNLKVLNKGMFASNTYIVEDNKSCVVIDCGSKAKDILKVINEMEATLKYIILTHGHIDHIVSLDELREETGAKVIIHESDNKMLTNGMANGSTLFARESKDFKAADETVIYEQIIDFENYKIRIIHTPGHTKGGICINIGDLIFTGDTLFKGSIGRTDFEGGSFDEIIKSINKLMGIFPGSFKVLPGHGPSSTLEIEAKTNPFLK